MKEYLIFFDSKQVKTSEQILCITQARKALRNARKGSGRYFNKDTDYISTVNYIELDFNTHWNRNNRTLTRKRK